MTTVGSPGGSSATGACRRRGGGGGGSGLAGAAVLAAMIGRAWPLLHSVSRPLPELPTPKRQN